MPPKHSKKKAAPSKGGFDFKADLMKEDWTAEECKSDMTRKSTASADSTDKKVK